MNDPFEVGRLCPYGELPGTWNHMDISILAQGDDASHMWKYSGNDPALFGSRWQTLHHKCQLRNIFGTHLTGGNLMKPSESMKIVIFSDSVGAVSLNYLLKHLNIIHGNESLSIWETSIPRNNSFRMHSQSVPNCLVTNMGVSYFHILIPSINPLMPGDSNSKWRVNAMREVFDQVLPGHQPDAIMM